MRSTSLKTILSLSPGKAVPRSATFIRSVMSHSSTPASSSRITLSPTEQKFCNLLNDFSASYNPPVECRIAGGWVRDKLLSLPSSDLDIALPLSSGYDFAFEFVSFLKTRHGDVTVGSVGKVAANPEQSKHLETGTTKIMGLECDFVGLRSETYTDSRIPNEVKLGTPVEDALRRDLTINALFYNVSTQAIEDLTGKGLEDLEARIARTPLPPKQTFFDDPLRVLRTIRFAGRFGLQVEASAADAARDTDVQAALRNKVSKERVGIEISKTLIKSPLLGLQLISDLGLHSSIFTCPGLPSDPPRDSALKMGLVIDEVLRRWGSHVEGVEHLWLAAALRPFDGEVVQGKKELMAVQVVIAEGLKLSTEVNKAVSNLFIAQTLLDPYATGRAEIGVVLQNQAVRPWRRSIVWALAQRILPHWDSEGEWGHAAEAELELWKAFEKRVEDLGLHQAIDRPLKVDGKSLLSLLSIKPGPLVQVILRSINVWQLNHPSASKEECENWVRERWEGDGRPEWEAAVPPAPDKKGKADKGEKRKR